jgi:hypothetical protein
MTISTNNRRASRSHTGTSPLGPVLGLFALIIASDPIHAQDSQSTRRTEIEATRNDIYAAVLFNFSKFVVWPDHAFETDDSPFIIAVLGNNPFPINLKAMEKRTVRGRPVVTRHFTKPSKIGSCHILYCNLEDVEMIHAATARLAGQSVLTVSAHVGFATHHGMIEFSAIRDRLALTINIDRARKVHLDIGADLLELATLVDTQKSISGHPE